MNHWSHTLKDKGPRLIQALVVLGVLACGPVEEEPPSVCETLRDDIEILNMRLERMDSVLSLSVRYEIDPRLAAAIVDVSFAEDLPPDLGARLVRVESDFESRARGAHGEIGLTQIKPSTAYGLGYRGARKGLYDPMTNLHYGFRYLREMIDRYDGDLDRALTAYNGGPGLADTGYVLFYARRVCGGPCS